MIIQRNRWNSGNILGSRVNPNLEIDMEIQLRYPDGMITVVDSLEFALDLLLSNQVEKISFDHGTGRFLLRAGERKETMSDTFVDVVGQWQYWRSDAK